MTLVINDNFLQPGEYYATPAPKDTIYLHHTAGGPNAVNVIAGWEADGKPAQPLKVATAFVIGGKTSKDATMDGKVYRAFDDKHWAHHLGTKLTNNAELNAKSVGIEVCNFGPLTKSKDGRFLTYINTEIPAADVVTFAKPFRGYTHYHAYTDKQIEVLRQLMVHLMTKHGIKMQARFRWDAAKFEVQAAAQQGKPGVWTHTNVRRDKFDMSPQPKLLDMLNTFYRD